MVRDKIQRDFKKEHRFARDHLLLLSKLNTNDKLTCIESKSQSL